MAIHELTEAQKSELAAVLPAGLICHVGSHENIPWSPLPWKNISKKLLFHDPVSGTTFELLRMEAGASFPEHYVTSTQISYLLEGRRVREDGAVMAENSFQFVPAGQVQMPIKAVSTTIELRYSSGVPVYVLSDGSTFVTRADGSAVLAGRLGFIGGVHPENLGSPKARNG